MRLKRQPGGGVTCVLSPREPGGSPEIQAGERPIGSACPIRGEAGGRTGRPGAGPWRGSSGSECHHSRSDNVPDSLASSPGVGSGDGREQTGRAAPPPPLPVSGAGMGSASCPWRINPPPPVVRMFLGAARADIPDIPNRNPRRGGGRPFVPGNESKRGEVAGFSQASRRSLQRTLATMDRHAYTVTMCLTLPGDCSSIDHASATKLFQTLARRFTSKARFRMVSVMWKRELQSRGALHWHLLVYGVERGSDLEASARAWLVSQWNALCCQDLTASAREEHRWWHARDENWQEVRNMSGYFAKYLGKDEAADPEEPIAGRWWGSWNKAALPVVSPTELVLPSPVAVDLHRWGRKLRQKRADEGKMRAIAARLSDVGSGVSPFMKGVTLMRDGPSPLSLWDLERLRGGYVREGRAEVLNLSGGLRIKESEFLLQVIRKHARQVGVRPGKFQFRGAVPNTAKIVVCGEGMPEVVLRFLAYSYQRHGLEMPPLKTRHEKGEEARQRRLRKMPLHQADLGIEGSGLAGISPHRLGSRADSIRKGRLNPAYAGCSDE